MNTAKFDVRWVLLPLLLIISIASFIYASSFTITHVVVEGNEIYSDEEAADYIFPTNADTPLWKVYLKYYILKKQNSIPFVQKYTVELLGIDTVKLTFYEKNVIGSFYYMSNYFYFDRDGIIVDSLGSSTEGIPVIEGLTFNRVVMYEALPVENSEIFTEILNLTQLLDRGDYAISRVSYDKDLKMTIYLEEPYENVKVYLGDSEHLADKLSVLGGIEEQMEGLDGTLYLDEVTSGIGGDSYIFKKNASDADSE